MNRNEIRVCIMRVPGTNRDHDAKRVFDYLGVSSEAVRLNEFTSRKKKLLDYHMLLFPGGFAHGDRIRAGAIWAKELMNKVGEEMREFVGQRRLILGICNGMQVCVEAGLIPGFRGISETSEASMMTNASAHFECRWVYLKGFSRGKSVFAGRLQNEILRVPVCHTEGRFMLPKREEGKLLRELETNDQIVFRYCRADGEVARGEYPINPNGALDDIAGVCNPEGNVLALMPHPEDASFWYQFPDWSRKGTRVEGGAINIFKSSIDYLLKSSF